MRNTIAHNKPICKKLQNDINSKVIQLNKSLTNATNKVNGKLQTLEQEYVRELAEEYEEDRAMEEAELQYYSEDDILEKIIEDDRIIDLYNTIEGFIFDYDSKIDNLYVLLEEIKNLGYEEDIDGTFKENCLSIFSAFDKIGYYDEYVELIKTSDFDKVKIRKIVIKRIKDNIEKIINFESKNEVLDMDVFAVNSTLYEHKSAFKDKVELTIKGDTNINRGESSIIELKLIINNDIFYGNINIQLGDYEYNDEQCNYMPIMDDEFNVDIDDIKSEIEKYSKETLNKIKILSEGMDYIIYG